jgi:hypothetical protein
MKGAVPQRPEGEGHPRKEAGRAQRDGQQDEEARGDHSPRTLIESWCPGGDVSRPPRAAGPP